MGTMLYARGVFLNRCFDELQPLEPRPGARASTRSTSRPAPTSSRPTPSARIASSSGPTASSCRCARSTATGAQIAREAAQGRGPGGGLDRPAGQAPRAFRQHLPSRTRWPPIGSRRRGSPKAGVDLFLDRDHALPGPGAGGPGRGAGRDARLPVVVSLTFTEEGTTFYGDKPEDVVRVLEDLGRARDRRELQPGAAADARDDAAHGAVRDQGAKLSAMPNAGAPALVDGRYVYLCTPEYMALLRAALPRGGRRAWWAAAAGRRPPTSGTSCARCACCSRRARRRRSLPPARPRETPQPFPREEKSPLARKLGKKFVVSVELDPPKGADPGGPDREGAVLQGERGRRHQRRPTARAPRRA